MGLYLCVFEDDTDIDGIDVGPYADFNALRNHVVQTLEGGDAGSKFPTFILHSDSDGEWSPEECEKLSAELADISAALKLQPAIDFVSPWQKAVAKSLGVVPTNAFESFIDVDGEFVLARLAALVRRALERRRPILFQ